MEIFTTFCGITIGSYQEHNIYCIHVDLIGLAFLSVSLSSRSIRMNHVLFLNILIYLSLFSEGQHSHDGYLRGSDV